MPNIPIFNTFADNTLDRAGTLGKTLNGYPPNCTTLKQNLSQCST